MARKLKKKANWLDPATTAENEVLPKYFNWAWSSRGVSLALNAVLLLQLTYYCTDMLGLSAGLVGTLLLVSKLFDGVTDLIVGFIIDRTHTKLGKARPYEICIVLVWLFSAMLFSVPEGLGTAGMAAYVFILYTLINSVCATFLNGGDAVYLARSVRSPKNRVSVMSFNGSIIMVCSIISGIVMPQLVAGIGSTRPGWIKISVSFAIPLAIIGLFRMIFIKEVAQDQPAEAGKDAKATQKVSVKQGLICIAKNKYVWLIAAITLCAQLQTNIGSAVGTYYFKYIFGNIGIQSIISLSNFATPILLAIFPLLARKFGATRLIRIGAAIGIIGLAIRTIGRTNLVTLIIGSFLGGMGILPITLMISIYLIDCMDYGEWKTGVRVEGIISSVNSFCSKVGSGLASSVVGIVMGHAGYDGSLAVQSAAANSAIVALYNWVPLILTVVMLILSILYNIDKYMPQIHKDLEERRKKANA